MACTILSGLLQLKLLQSLINFRFSLNVNFYLKTISICEGYILRFKATEVLTKSVLVLVLLISFSLLKDCKLIAEIRIKIF